MRKWKKIGLGLLCGILGICTLLAVWVSHRSVTEEAEESPTGKSRRIEYVHAEGKDKGKPMDQLPVFTPQSGIGQGVPIYDSPKIDLSFSLSSANRAGIRSAKVKYLGSRHSLTETAKGSFAFSNHVVSLSLSDEIEAPYVGGAEKWLRASVTIPALGITNATYSCVGQSANSFRFENNRYGLVFSNDTLTGTAQLDISTMYSSDYAELTETEIGSGVFTNEHYSVMRVSIMGLPCLAVSDGGLLSNTFFSVWETVPQSGVFRNFKEAIPTNLPARDLAVPDFVPWRIKITGVTDPSLVSQVSISTPVDSIDTITFSKAKDSLLSDQKFILIPNGPLEAPIPSKYTPIRSDTLNSRWWDEEQKNVTVQVTLRGISE